MPKLFLKSVLLFTYISALIFFPAKKALSMDYSGRSSSGVLISGVNNLSMETRGILLSGPNLNETKINEFLRINNIRSLEDYTRWLKANFHYQFDSGKDTWSSPMQTLAVRAGDCEDYSFLTEAVLKKLGYQAQVIAVVKPNDAHAMCVFKKDGVYHVFDNEKLKRINASTLEGVAAFFFAKHNYTLFLELDLAKKDWQILYVRKS